GRQCARPVQKLRNVADAAVGNLQLTQTVVRVLDALRKHGFRRTISVGDRESRGIVARVYNTETRGDLLNGLALERVRLAQVVLRLQTSDVGIDIKRHCISLIEMVLTGILSRLCTRGLSERSRGP